MHVNHHVRSFAVDYDCDCSICSSNFRIDVSTHRMTNSSAIIDAFDPDDFCINAELKYVSLINDDGSVNAHDSIQSVRTNKITFGKHYHIPNKA
jgi:hypothetical protein